MSNEGNVLGGLLNVDAEQKEEKPLRWYQKMVIWFVLTPAILLCVGHVIRRGNQIKRTKDRIKYFNPIIKKDFFGNERVEWVGRKEPLTDDELSKLF